MKSIWIVEYEGNEIKIESTWFNGDRLYVNNKLQDEKFSLFITDLTGNVITKSGEKHLIKINLGGWFSINCRAFINDEKVKVKQIK